VIIECAPALGIHPTYSPIPLMLLLDEAATAMEAGSDQTSAILNRPWSAGYLHLDLSVKRLSHSLRSAGESQMTDPSSARMNGSTNNGSRVKRHAC